MKNTNYFNYTIAGDGFGFNIVTKTKLNEDTVTDILWNYAPFRCNVCGDVEEYTYDEVMDEVESYDNSSLYIGDNSRGWESVISQLTQLM